jgi:hypothetical protein
MTEVSIEITVFLNFSGAIRPAVARPELGNDDNNFAG